LNPHGKTRHVAVALCVLAFAGCGRTQPAAPVNPTQNLSLRSTVLDPGGIVDMTIRNNNAFPVRNIFLHIIFKPVTRAVTEPVYSFDWSIPDLISPGSDYQFTAIDSAHPQILPPHAHGSSDEWIPQPQFISAEAVNR
jgi:hypothetical protein